MTPTDTTFNVVASYYHDEWKKMVPSHEYEGFETLELAMEQAEYHQAKGFDVKVYKCDPVMIVRLTGLDEEAAPEEADEEVNIEWQDIHVDALGWDDYLDDEGWFDEDKYNEEMLNLSEGPCWK
jgi:hypothetical protein